MEEYVAVDVHKHYTFAGRENVETGRVRHRRIEHERGSLAGFLSDVERGTTVALEATDNWYWIVDQIEASGMKPALLHPRKAKVMLGCINREADGVSCRYRSSGAKGTSAPSTWS